MVQRVKLENGNDPTISVSGRYSSFSCKIPIYESDDMGRPIVRIWDCENRRTLTYSQAEWERKQRNEGV
jgi:hypothetical protein